MMGSKGRMRDPPGILRWNASYWLESSLCEKQYKCHLLTRSHISSIFRQFPSLLVQLKARCASRGSCDIWLGGDRPEESATRCSFQAKWLQAVFRRLHGCCT